MGLFWKSESDRIIEEIQDITARVNMYLRQIEQSLIANDGASSNNINDLVNWSQSIAPFMVKANNLYEGLCDKGKRNTDVPWVDGRYFHYSLYVMSVISALNKVEYAIKHYHGTDF